MSLMKSFNGKFFKENMRKSKGVVILSLVIVPILTALVLLKGYAEYENFVVLEPIDVSAVNLIIMAIIPFIYTNILFGFVYKKKSTDFINSMPVNRKTIYVSNTIGGIFLITIMQIITATIIMGCTFISSSLAIIPSVVLSTLGVMWLSYVFMFMTNNLAMTVSGTQMTQFVVAVCILFIVPFSCDCIYNMAKEENPNFGTLTIVQEDGSKVTQDMNKVDNYTLPYNAIKAFGEYDEMVTTVSVVKTIILSIVYGYLGLKLYMRRKMENNEEPFATYKAHLVLKTITLIPILLVLNLISSSGGDVPFVVALVLIIIYYIVYDFIIKRKVPLGVTIISMITTLVLLQASIFGIRAGSTFLKSKTLELDDIKAIALETSSISTWYNYYDSTELSSQKFFIEDEDFKEMVVKNLRETYYNNYYYTYDYSDYNSSDNEASVKIYFKTKFGNVYSGEFSLKNYDKVVNKLEENEDYIEYLNKMVAKKGVVTFGDTEVGSEIEDALNNALEQIELSNSDIDTTSYSLTKYIYLNNKIVSCNIPVDLTDELLKVVAKESNTSARKAMNKSSYKGYSVKAYYSSGNDEYVKCSDEIFEFALECTAEDFDETKSYVVIEMTVNGKDVAVFTNKVKEFKKLRNLLYND